MDRSIKECKDVNNSNIDTSKSKQRKYCVIVEDEPVKVQVIHQFITPREPRNIIGEKVVYNESYLKRLKTEPCVPIPECGYFTITDAVLKDDGRVMVALYPYPTFYQKFNDGTHICVGNMKKYKP